MSTLQPTDFPGPFERHERAVFSENRLVRNWLKWLSPDSIMIDVGAHTGSSARWFVDQGWQVFAFEPDPRNRQQLAARFRNRQIQIDPRAVGDQVADAVPFYASDASTGISSLSAFTAGHTVVSSVTVTTLREACWEYQIDHVDFLKIDTEGYDFMVLRGFPWDQMAPRVIECEFEDPKTTPLGYAFHDMARFLVEKGYIVWVSEWYPIIRYGIQHDWRGLMPYPCELNDPAAWGNLIAYLPDQGITPSRLDLDGTYDIAARWYTSRGATRRLKILLRRALPNAVVQWLQKLTYRTS